MNTTNQACRQLFSIRGWHKGSGIHESTARTYKKRFLEGKLELETKIKILRMCGYSVEQEMMWGVVDPPSDIRIELWNKLHSAQALWSYDSESAAQMSDEELIEYVLLYLDLEDVSKLFSHFPKPVIKRIWKKKMLIQEPVYHNLNRLYAFLYFDIKNPDRYVRDAVLKREKTLQ
jgi:hypothetical protein